MEEAEPFETLCALFRELERGRSVALSGDATPPSGVSGIGPWVGVSTSGTTGHPIRVWRAWREFKESIAVSSSRMGWAWATGFRPDSYAGAQVAAQAWLERGKVHFMKEVGRSTWRLLEQESVDAISATPTFVDLILSSSRRAQRWCPRQLTLGGEVLRSVVGQRIRAQFFGARIQVVYASSELGLIFRTRRMDGLYEVKGLDLRFQGWRLTTEGLATSEKSGALELLLDGEWRRTGDVAEWVAESSGEECIRLVGRCDAVANVGGTKVSLDWVVSVAESVPGVARAVAWAERNAVVGEVIGLRVEPEPGLDWVALRPQVERCFWSRLPKPGWPRVWEVGVIGLGVNGKRVRR